MGQDMTQLSSAQKAAVDKIVDYGIAHGYSKELINIVVNFANYESDLGQTQRVGSKYIGMFQYGLDAWKTSYNYYVKTQDIELPLSADKAINKMDYQIAVMYSDLGRWSAGYEQGRIAKDYKNGGNLYSVAQTLSSYLIHRVFALSFCGNKDVVYLFFCLFCCCGYCFSL
jgi:hypothetical protein